MIKVKCSSCDKELDVPGGLAFSPPSDDGKVTKYHLCLICWDMFESGIRLHKRFAGRTNQESCPESDWPAPNDVDDEADLNLWETKACSRQVPNDENKKKESI